LNAYRRYEKPKLKREFHYINDAAEGIVLAKEKFNKADPVNRGAGFERIQEFIWKRSTDLFEQFIIDRTGRLGTQEKV